MPTTLFDSHCHFDFEVFNSERLDIWQACHAQGLKQLLIPGVEPKQWLISANIASQYDGIYTAAGLHPWWVSRAGLPEQDEWARVLSSPKCLAVGECGLDATIEAPLHYQGQILEQHLQMAVDLQMPLILHVRQTHNETLRYLKRYKPAKGGVIHGFTGSKELAMAYWRMGFYIGVGGSITYPRANKTRTMVQAMPLEALLLETDAPDMPLHDFQGSDNSPAQLLRIATTLAELRGDTLENIAQHTTQNSRHLFQCP